MGGQIMELSSMQIIAIFVNVNEKVSQSLTKF